jgi:CRISPR-associated protein Cmr5
MQTRDQKYATDVYTRVSLIKDQGAFSKSYGATAHKLPILIHTAGLVQALSFVDARSKESPKQGKDPQKQLLQDLAGTVGQPDAASLLKRAREADISEYMLLTQQVQDALLWYKRFAQSVLGVEASDAKDDQNADVPQ